MSHSLFKALETSEMLMVSEYSYEMAFNTKFKSQDYDFFHEMVGAEDHIENVLNLHRVYISLILGMEKEINSMTDDLSLLSRFDSLVQNIKQ